MACRLFGRTYGRVSRGSHPRVRRYGLLYFTDSRIRPMLSCQRGPTRHAYVRQMGPIWHDTRVRVCVCLCYMPVNILCVNPVLEPVHVNSCFVSRWLWLSVSYSFIFGRQWRWWSSQGCARLVQGTGLWFKAFDRAPPVECGRWYVRDSWTFRADPITPTGGLNRTMTQEFSSR